MIDMESAIFTKLATALRTEYPDVTVVGEYLNAPPKFPFVSIVEADNYADTRYLDGGGEEKYARILYEVNVYSDKAGTKKSECRKLLKRIDAMLHGMNLVRISMNPVPNLEDATIYRLNARYEGVTDGETIYRK